MVERQPRGRQRHRAEALENAGEPLAHGPVDPAQHGVGADFEFAYPGRASLTNVDQHAVHAPELTAALVDEKLVQDVAREVDALSHQTPAQESPSPPARTTA